MTECQMKRRSIRLKGYDYAFSGAHFVTVCAHARRPLFRDGSLVETVVQSWDGLVERFPSISLDAFVVMPNHIHFVVWLNPVGAPLVGARGGVGPHFAGAHRRTPPRAGTSPAPTLGQIVGALKSIVATKWRQQNGRGGSGRVWQRNYYERVIRDEEELNRVREYILLNPQAWEFDRENPIRVGNSQYEEQWGWLEVSDRPEHVPLGESRHA